MEVTHNVKWTDDRGGVHFELNSNPHERRFTLYVWLLSYLPNILTYMKTAL